MKKKYIVLIVLATICTTTLKSQTGNVEKQFVAKFLSFMHAERGPNYPEMMNCISPNYLKINNLDKSNLKVNNYTIWGFTIVSYSETDSMASAKVYGQKHSWTYILTFKLSKENNRFYILPASHDSQWIHPWWTVETVNK